MTMIRLNKYLAECGVASRRKSEEFIKNGRVSVNKKIVKDLSTSVDVESDVIKLDGEIIKPEHKVYYLLNKPKGFVTTTKDERNRPKVTDLIDTNVKIFPVGRLDYNTTGLLLLTNDGDFANKMLHPSNKVKREYKVEIDKSLSISDKEKMLKGIFIDRRKSKFTLIKYAVKNNFKKMFVETEEGRNHFVKKMFSALDYRVQSLERVRFGKLKISGVDSGKYKKLSGKQIAELIDEI